MYELMYYRQYNKLEIFLILLQKTCIHIALMIHQVSFNCLRTLKNQPNLRHYFLIQLMPQVYMIHFSQEYFLRACELLLKLIILQLWMTQIFLEVWILRVLYLIIRYFLKITFLLHDLGNLYCLQKLYRIILSHL